MRTKITIRHPDGVACGTPAGSKVGVDHCSVSDKAYSWRERSELVEARDPISATTSSKLEPEAVVSFLPLEPVIFSSKCATSRKVFRSPPRYEGDLVHGTLHAKLFQEIPVSDKAKSLKGCAYGSADRADRQE